MNNFSHKIVSILKESIFLHDIVYESTMKMDSELIKILLKNLITGENICGKII